MDQQQEMQFDITLIAGSAKKVMDEVGAKSRDLWQVPVEQIKVIPGFNVREKDEAYHEHIESLAKSILTEGFYQDKPLAGYVAREGDKEVIYLTDGHCRFEGTQLANSRGANITRLPLVIKPNSSSLEDLTVSLVVSNSGKPLTPYEVGVVCKRLVGYGWDNKEIAGRLGFTEQYVDQLLTLMGAPLEIRKMVQAGALSAANAVDMLRKHGAKAVEILLNAQQKANEAGQKKVTARHLPGATFKKVITKEAPAMLNTLREIKEDPGFANLSESMRLKLEEVLSKLAQAEGENLTGQTNKVADASPELTQA